MYFYPLIKIIGDPPLKIVDNLLLFYVIPTRFPRYFRKLIKIDEENVAIVDLQSFEKGCIYKGELFFENPRDKNLEPYSYNFLNLELEDVFKEGERGELIIYRKNSIIYIEPKEDLENDIVFAHINPYQRKPLNRETLNRI